MATEVRGGGSGGATPFRERGVARSWRDTPKISEKRCNRVCATLAISLAPYRSHSGPSGPKSKKSKKKKRKPSRGLSAPGSKEVKRRSKKGQKRLTNNLLPTFLTPPGNLFGDFFGISRPKGPKDSCKGPRRLQCYAV